MKKQSEGQAEEIPMPPQQCLSPERLAELRLWIERRGYADPEVQRMIAACMLEQGDLK